MAVETKYTCDRCGHSQDSDKQMWSIGICYRHGTAALNYGASTSIYAPALWCRACLVKFNVLGSQQVEEEKKTMIDPPPTLEDMIREIARQEVTAMTGAA